MAVQTLGTFTVENKEFYEKALLKRLKENTPLYDLAQKTIYPKHAGDTISWRKFDALELPKAPLQEGVTPKPNKLSISKYRATMKQYGDHIAISDLFDLEGIDPVVTETAELFGEQAGKLFETLIRDELMKTTNVYTVSTALTIDDIHKVRAILLKSGAKPMADGYFRWYISADMELAIKKLANNSYTEVWKYSNSEKIESGEVGKFLGFKFIVNENATKYEDEISHSLIIGRFENQIPYGVVTLEGAANKPSIIHKPLGSAGTDDPLNQRQTLGWKVNGFATRLLYEEAIMEVRCNIAEAITSFGDSYDDSDREHFVEKVTGSID